MEDIKVVVGRNIKNFRLMKKFTQNNLAKMVGVSPSYIANIERGKKVPSLELLEKIANILEVGPDTLLAQPDDLISIELRKLIGTLSGKGLEPIRFMNEVAAVFIRIFGK